MMSDAKQVFISYSRRDGNAQAERLERELRAKGFRVWRDVRDIDPVKDFTADIERGIQDSDFIIVCVTKDTQRPDSFVRREIYYASLWKKPILITRFEDVIPSISIVTNEWIDFFKGEDKAFSRLGTILEGDANEFRQQTASGDPFQPYLEMFYKRVVGFLERAVIKLIDLSSEATPDAVNASLHRKDMIDLFFEAQGIGGELPSEPKPFHTFAEAFEHYEGRVLLLGEPGAGKTITLFATARDAAARRLNDPTAPLPLLGLISSWDAKQQIPLADWLVSGYPELDSASIKQVIAEGKALLLLDGLDELGGEHPFDPEKPGGEKYDPRKQFMAQVPINNAVIVTCRVKDYDEIGEKISLRGALTLRPLTEMQMQLYLTEQSELWEAVQADDTLRKMLNTPLLLSIFAFAYADMTTEERQQLIDLSKSPGDLRDKIFETYVQKRYEWEIRNIKRRGEKISFSLPDIYNVLGGLAFYDINDNANNVIIIDNLPSSVYRKDNGIYTKEIFTQLVVSLRLFSPQSNQVLRFSHLLLRDYFGFTYAMKELLSYSPYNVVSLGIAANVLGKLQDQRAVEPLLDVLASRRERDGFLRSMAALALSELGDTRAIEVLAMNMFDEDAILRTNVMLSLGKFNDLRVFEFLIQGLDDEDSNVRLAATNGLRKLGDMRVAKEFVKLIRDDSVSFVKESASIGLGELGNQEVVEELLEMLQADNIDIRKYAAMALGGIGNKRAVLQLISLFSSENDYKIRATIADALRRIGDVRASDCMLVALRDEAPGLRFIAALAFTEWKDPRAVEPLIDLLSDNTQMIVGPINNFAAKALENIATIEALEAVQKWREERGKQNE
ncbi:MAG: HEAT repeat domain-containing protein [Anaerolineae bacterium]|nr:HEAT repeat domain-containing protein [Anaerolineae bacterium]